MEYTIAKKKPNKKTGRFATLVAERVPKAFAKEIIKKSIDAKRESVSIRSPASIETPTRIRQPKLAQPMHSKFDIDAFADELLETDSVILDIFAK